MTAQWHFIADPVGSLISIKPPYNAPKPFKSSSTEESILINSFTGYFMVIKYIIVLLNLGIFVT